MGERCTAAERTGTVALDIVAPIDVCKTGTFGEGTVGNALHLAADMHRCKRRATVESITADGSDAVANRGCNEGCTATESTALHGSYTIGNLHGLELGATMESAIANNGTSVINGHRSDIDTTAEDTAIHRVKTGA